MKLTKILVAMTILYWAGTTEPMLQGQKARIVCGEHKNQKVIVNYTWANGAVDVRYGLFGTKHYYIKDYHCLEKNN